MQQGKQTFNVPNMGRGCVIALPLVSTDLLLDTSVFNTVELRFEAHTRRYFCSFLAHEYCADCGVGSTTVVHTVDSSDI